MGLCAAQNSNNDGAGYEFGMKSGNLPKTKKGGSGTKKVRGMNLERIWSAVSDVDRMPLTHLAVPHHTALAQPLQRCLSYDQLVMTWYVFSLG